MTDLQNQIETYLRETSIPVDVDDLVARLESEFRTDMYRKRVWLRRRPAVAFAATALAVLLIGVPLLVFGVFSPTPVSEVPVTTPTTPEPVTPTTEALPTTTTSTAPVPAPAEPVSGEWTTFGVAEGLPGTPIDAVAVDSSGGVWVLAHTDDPTIAQLYSMDPDTRVFEARGEPLQLAGEWLALWMETTPTGVIVALGESEEWGERLLQWDDEGWHELTREHDLPVLDMSIAQRSADGDVRVAGYTTDFGPAIIDITSDGVTHAVAPDGAWGGGGPSVFTMRQGVLAMGPDGRSWFSDSESSIAAFGDDGYEVYNAGTESGCCFVPLAADQNGVWAYLGSSLGRYDLDGWRAEISVPLTHGDEVSTIVATADGAIWVLGRYRLARFVPGKSDGEGQSTWTIYSGSEARSAGLPLTTFQTTVIREGDVVWVANWSNGLSVWLHDGHEWAQVDIPDGIDQEDTGFRQNTVAASSTGIWVATSTGVATFERSP